MSYAIEATLIPRAWNDPRQCPFGGAGPEDGGPGFIDHLRTSQECKDGFELWRELVVDDIKGGWSGLSDDRMIAPQCPESRVRSS